MNIALLDNDLDFLISEVDYINNITTKENFSCQCDVYTDAPSFFKAIETKNYNLFLLDIHMPDIGGFEVAEIIRRTHKTSMIVFVSSQEQLVFDCFQYLPLKFVRKRTFKEDLYDLFVQIVRLTKEQTAYISLKIESEINKFLIDSIIYVESEAKKVILHTTCGDYKFYYKISDMEQSLIDHKFLRCHKSYLVNFKYIKSICRAGLEFENGTTLPISKHRYLTVKEEFEKYMRCTL